MGAYEITLILIAATIIWRTIRTLKAIYRWAAPKAGRIVQSIIAR